MIRPAGLLYFCVLVLVLAACATGTQQTPPAPAESFAVSCGHGDGACAAINGALLLMSAASRPMNSADSREPRDSIRGHCAIQVGIRTPQPCAGVVLELKSRDIGDRRAWIDGYEFEVPAVGRAPLELNAYSDRYGASAKLANVKVGSFLSLLINVAAPR